MYSVENLGKLVTTLRTARRQPSAKRVSRNVVLLGFTSMLTDISSEMVTTVLPLYMVFVVGFSPLQFGAIDGLQQGAAVLLRSASGFIGDRSRRHKDVAFVGYGLSALARLGLLLGGQAWVAITAATVADRLGKGIRTAPRDALISLSSSQEGRATAFGVHRALDTTGALIGPLLAFALLTLIPGSYAVIFLISFCFALLGLSVLGLFVKNHHVDQSGGEDGDQEEPRTSLRSTLRLLKTRRIGGLTLVAAALGLFTVSDSFIYLVLQRQVQFEVTTLPLLYVGTALIFALLAVPFGRLADRLGWMKVFFGGQVLLVCMYGVLLFMPPSRIQVGVCLLLFGAYYAATDGVLMANASKVIPASIRGTGLGLLATALGMARLLASIVFGAVWTWQGMDFAVATFTCGLILATLVSALAMKSLTMKEAT